ncbi:MAG: nucleoside triphosphate pyrophosphohydrolase family protein [Clostridia bacterium]|nr:nucleoside triphosphate pyrophosphohydrolase family protein [Clostridia bacterium]
MDLNQYQEKAMTTCMPSSENFSYMLLNLVGEVGEFASKVAKGIRKGHCSIGLEPNIVDAYDIANETTANELWQFFGMEESLEELKKEAGDILWQLSGLCSVMGWFLEDVAQMNLDKLAARKEAGTIDGNGDGIIRDK